MIEVVRTIDTRKLHLWLESQVRPYLKPDVSSYARGRLTAWLRVEPELAEPFESKPAMPVSDSVWNRLTDLIEWRFDYCLVTYSGEGTGIKPHRDAKYADFEAFGLNVNGSCEFRYWEGRRSFGRSPNLKEYDTTKEAPTHIINLNPGDVIHFNCKNKHSAIASPHRWNLNFWRAKADLPS